MDPCCSSLNRDQFILYTEFPVRHKIVLVCYIGAYILVRLDRHAICIISDCQRNDLIRNIGICLFHGKHLFHQGPQVCL